jgi:speckle-type POZ protein
MSVGALTVNIHQSFKWEIQNFNQRPEINGQGFFSPKFSVNDLKDRSGDCALKIYPNGENKECSEYVSIYLENVSDKLLTLSYSVSVLDSNGMKMEESISHNREYRPSKKGWGFDDFLQIKLLIKDGEIINNGVLIIQLDIVQPGPGYAVASLSDDLHKYFMNNSFSDIKVLCNNEKFDCHRVLLAARSPVFEAMCLGGFREGTSGEINLNHMDINVVKVGLESLYVRVHLFPDILICCEVI